MTYDGLDDVSKIVCGSKDDGPLLGIVGADFVDPAQNQRTPASLDIVPSVSASLLTVQVHRWPWGEERRAYTNVAKPVEYHAAGHILIERHLPQSYSGAQLPLCQLKNQHSQETAAHTMKRAPR